MNKDALCEPFLGKGELLKVLPDMFFGNRKDLISDSGSFYLSAMAWSMKYNMKEH